MTLRKPIVLIDGILREIPVTDTIDLPQVPGVTFESVNASPNLQRIATPVAIGSQGFQPGQASVIDLAELAGLVQSVSVSPNAPGTIQTAGEFGASAAQWQQVTGEQGGLTAGVRYYLSSTQPGRMVSTLPTSGFIVHIGKALSNTRLLLDIRPPIGL